MQKPDKNQYLIFGLVVTLAVIGYFLFSQFADYTYMSKRHMMDIYRAKAWAIFLILLFALIIFWKRKSNIAPYLAIFGVSLYFIIVYATLFRGTEYGMNGHWGDNGFRLAVISKMMEYFYFTDSSLKDLTSMYPPLYFYIMALYAKLFGMEAFQTVKMGYLFVFIIYPWALFLAWRPLVKGQIAAVIAIAALFLTNDYLLYVPYEHIGISLFIPWWLYFFEDVNNRGGDRKLNIRFYIPGIIFGTLLFLTYYYWFFIAIITIPISLAIRYNNDKSIRSLLSDIRHKAIIGIGVAILGAIYWMPLIISGFKYGFKSYQALWFNFGVTDITDGWSKMPLETAIFVAGLFFAGYLWRYWKNGSLLQFYLGALLLIMLDRLFNLGGQSIQTRKILEFALILIIPAFTIGAGTVWQSLRNVDIKRGMIIVTCLLLIVYSNGHTSRMATNLYKNGINQRYPERSLQPFKYAKYHDKVYLTNRYIENCYVPFFAFIPLSSVSGHIAGNFEGRKEFLKLASKLEQPDQFAYALSNNIYDPIDYVFLRWINHMDSYELQLRTVPFNSLDIVDTLYFAKTLFNDNNYFKLVHADGLYEVIAHEWPDSLYSLIAEKNRDLIPYLKPLRNH